MKKFLQGKCTPEEARKVMKWFDTIGEEKFLELVEEDWHHWSEHTTENKDRLLHILGKIHTRISEKELDLIHKEKQLFPTVTPYKRYNYRRYSVAAVVGLLAFAAITFVLHWSNLRHDVSAVALKSKQVPKGQKASLYLSDGTKVILNAGSRITYPERFSDTSRVVQLQGEAFFDVVKDKEKPFSVISGDLITTALGTSFNVKAYEQGESVEIALATGKVEVRGNRKKKTPVILLPGESLTLDTGRGVFRKEKFSTKEKLGWIENLLYFRDAEAREVFGTLERWYGVEFIFNKEVGEKWRYSGEFKNKSLETVLKGIAYVKEFEFSFKGASQVEIYFK